MTVQEFMNGMGGVQQTIEFLLQVLGIMCMSYNINQNIQPFWRMVSEVINKIFPNMPEMNVAFVFSMQNFAITIAVFMCLRYLEYVMSNNHPRHGKPPRQGKQGKQGKKGK